MSQDWKYAVKDVEDFKKRGFSSYYCILINGKDSYTNKTVDDYINQGFTILTDTEFYDLLEEYKDSICDKWCEISEEFYEQQLNILPPLFYHNGGFYVRESETDDIYSFYQRLNNKYYASLQRLSSSRDDILQSLKNAISNNQVKNRVDN